MSSFEPKAPPGGGSDADSAVSDDAPRAPEVSSDGRVQRGKRTRHAVIDALLTLIDEGNQRPSARAIADRAGVSLRSVYVHFEDREALFLAVGHAQHLRLAELIHRIDARLTFDERLDAWTTQRAEMLEVGKPVRRAAAFEATSSRAIREYVMVGRSFDRAFIEEVFAQEIEGLPEPEREMRVDLADMFSSGQAWDRLREGSGGGGHTVEEATAAVRMALRAILSP